MPKEIPKNIILQTENNNPIKSKISKFKGSVSSLALSILLATSQVDTAEAKNNIPDSKTDGKSHSKVISLTVKKIANTNKPHSKVISLTVEEKMAKIKKILSSKDLEPYIMAVIKK
jgi:hypothetical protein